MRSPLFRSKSKQNEGSHETIQAPLSPHDLYREDFAVFSGKAIFECNLVKAMMHLAITNYQVEQIDIIKELENGRQIPRLPKADRSKTEIQGIALFTNIFHVYHSKTFDERWKYEKALFEEIVVICRTLREGLAEMPANSVCKGTSVVPGYESLQDDRNASNFAIQGDNCREPSATEISHPVGEHTLSAPKGTASTGLPDIRFCRTCQDQTVIKATKPWNKNGNIKRLMHYCRMHGFHSWADDKGVDPANAHCGCGQPSRLDQSGQQKGGTWFLSCAKGFCKFYEELEDKELACDVETLSLQVQDNNT